MGLDDGLNHRDIIKENNDDMIVAAGRDITALLMLKKCYDELIVIAKPYTDAEGRIFAPSGLLPVDKISNDAKVAVNKMDGAFLETVAMTEFMVSLKEGLNAVVEKIAKMQAGGESLGRELR